MLGHATMLATPLFRVPPFPRARHRDLMQPCKDRQDRLGDDDLRELIESTRMARVGGSYWGLQPELPEQPYSLVRVRDPKLRSEILSSIGAGSSILVWLGEPDEGVARSGAAIMVVTGCCDPWHLLRGAELVYSDACDELALIAAIAGTPVRCVGKGQYEGLDENAAGQSALHEIFRDQMVDRFGFLSPFSDKPITPAKAVELCSYWRELVDSNRDISAAAGFASWKRSTIEPLLWGGSTPVRFTSNPSNDAPGKSVAVWKSRLSRGKLDRLEQCGLRLVEVEDGFIRSVGLGADCVPPLSIVVDHLGIYFDPGRESDLERMLQEGSFSAELLARARQLRELIVELGLGKYGRAESDAEKASVQPGTILVPGQVEDDRSVKHGGGDIQSNLELLRRVRAGSPDAYIIYKPHPDVEAGHRVGKIADQACLTLANEIVRDMPISKLFDRVESVHVNTSLAGFEALLRSKQVTTYGVPFYAGWGLTRDLGQIPARRTARLTLDELVAAALLTYPRYVDPVTGLPCPPEVLIERLSNGPDNRNEGFLVPLRRLQGRMKRAIPAIRSVRA